MAGSSVAAAALGSLAPNLLAGLEVEADDVSALKAPMGAIKATLE